MMNKFLLLKQKLLSGEYMTFDRKIQNQLSSLTKTNQQKLVEKKINNQITCILWDKLTFMEKTFLIYFSKDDIQFLDYLNKLYFKYSDVTDKLVHNRATINRKLLSTFSHLPLIPHNIIDHINDKEILKSICFNMQYYNYYQHILLRRYTTEYMKHIWGVNETGEISKILFYKHNKIFKNLISM